MSNITNVLLSLSNQEFWYGDEHRDECEALNQVNAWFPSGGLVDMAPATYASEAHAGLHGYLYAGGFDDLDVIGLIKVVFDQEWHDPKNLQLFIRGEQHDRFELIEVLRKDREDDQHQDQSVDSIGIPVVDPGKVLPILFEPSDPVEFKRLLLVQKKAIIETHYSDGHVTSKVWNAERFSDESNLIGNLRSRPDFRSGAWQAKGIACVRVMMVEN